MDDFWVTQRISYTRERIGGVIVITAIVHNGWEVRGCNQYGDDVFVLPGGPFINREEAIQYAQKMLDDQDN